MRGTYENIMATSGESLKIYNVNNENKSVELKQDLKNVAPFNQQNEFSAPLTSFDWNNESKNLIGTASIDTTCTIWDIEKSQVYTQLIGILIIQPMTKKSMISVFHLRRIYLPLWAPMDLVANSTLGIS